MILVAGALLLTPGFFTDAVGFALLMPPVRRAAFAYLRKRVHVTRFEMGPDGPRQPASDDIVDGEYHEIDPEAEPIEPPRAPTHRPSGWTRH